MRLCEWSELVAINCMLEHEHQTTGTDINMSFWKCNIKKLGALGLLHIIQQL